MVIPTPTSYWWIQQVPCGIGFAPEERDVYSYRAPPNLAPIGAKPDSETIAETSKRGGAPTELRNRKGPAGYIHLAPPGRSGKECSVCPSKWNPLTSSFE